MMFIKSIVITLFISKIMTSPVVFENEDFDTSKIQNQTNKKGRAEASNLENFKDVSNQDCNHIRFQTREIWGARPYLARNRIEAPVDKIFFSVSSGHRCYNFPQCAFFVRHLQNFHMDILKISDIDFNLLIGDDSRVYIGRGYDTQRELDPQFNSNSLMIGFLGNINSVKFISPKNLHIIYKIIKCGQIQGFVANSYTIYEPAMANCKNGLAAKMYRFIKEDRLNNVSFVCLPRK